MPLQQLEIFSTAGCARADGRLAYWNQVAASTLGPVAIDAAGSDFEATLKRIRLRDLEIIAPTSPPATIRTGAIGRATGMLNLQVQHRGISSTHVGDRVARLQAGDFMLFDPSAVSLQQFVEPTEAIIVRLPVAGAEARTPGLRNMLGVPVSGKSGAGVMLSQFIRTTWEQLEHGGNLEWADSLCDVIWPLIDMAYTGVRNASPALGRADKLRRDILGFTDRHCLDSDLTVSRIAAELDVSTRYVQMTFARMQTTPSAYVRSRRLEHAARQLANPYCDTPITGIALDSGFGDLSTFCRLFRSRYGVSPRAYRGGQRRTPGQACT